MGDYRQSDAYRRSVKVAPDGRPVFPLAFADRPVERPANREALRG